MEKNTYPSILLIAGQSQNVGKTSLACQIIKHFSISNEITYLKISPHFHKNIGDTDLITSTNNYQLHEDKQVDLNKDTNRALKAGASRSFLLLYKKQGILDGFLHFVNSYGNHPVICESRGLIEVIKPGIYIFIRQLYCQVQDIFSSQELISVDRLVTYTRNGFDFSPNELSLQNGVWSL